MRILLFNWFYYPVVGGAETVVSRQAATLARHGYDVLVVTSAKKIRSDEVIDGISVIRLPEFNPNYNDGRMATVAKKLFDGLIVQWRPDVIHAHALTYPFAPLRSRAMYESAKERGIPLVLHAHDAQLKTPDVSRPLVQLAWDHILCVSEYAKARYIAQGAVEAKITVVHNPIDTQEFDPNRVSITLPELQAIEARYRDVVKIVFPGRVFTVATGEYKEQKRFRTVATAAGMLTQYVKNFVVIAPKNEHFGSPEAQRIAEATLHSTLQEAGIVDRMQFVASLAPSDMPQLFKLADIVAHPSVNESFGLVLAESMAMERPTIGGNSGGAKELIESSVSGYLVDSDDPTELSAVLRQLAQSVALRVKIGRAARKRIQTRYSIAGFFTELERVYATVRSSASRS